VARYYLIRDSRPHGVEYLVFTVEDPRRDGYAGPQEEGVSLDSNGEDVFTQDHGEPPTEVCLGRDHEDPGHYRFFRSLAHREAHRYDPVAGVPVVLRHWLGHLRNTGRD
jgi:hypothetical protein